MPSRISHLPEELFAISFWAARRRRSMATCEISPQELWKVFNYENDFSCKINNKKSQQSLLIFVSLI